MTSPVITVDRTRKGALKALREGRVTVRAVGFDGGPKAVTAAAVVRGHTGRHEVSFMSDRWRCTCGSDLAWCAHVFAVQLVTGHADTPDRRPDPSTAGDRLDPDRMAALLEQPGWVPARFSGHCSRCDRPWQPGAPITTVRDRWVGACCVEDLVL